MIKTNWMALCAICLLISGAGMGSLFLSISPTAQASDISENLEEVFEENSATLSVTGSSTIQAEPDQVGIQVEMTAKHLQATSAKDEVSSIINQVLDAVRALGISDDEMATLSYTIQPEYEWIDDSRVFTGYRVTCLMKITVKEIGTAGVIIDSIVDHGGFVTSIDFELSADQQDELKLLALEEAAHDAKLKADVVASALGHIIGDVISITIDHDYQPLNIWRSTYSLDYGGQKNVPTEILPGDASVSASVSIVFEVL